MSFPFEFVKTRGDYDFISPVANLTINAAVVAVGGISLGAISYLALQALGFSKVTATIATAIPVTMGVAGMIGAAMGVSFFIVMCIEFTKKFSHR